MVTIADSYEIHKKGVYEMKDKKTNVWVPVAVIIGILLVAMIVLTVFMVVTGRSAGNTGSSSSKYHADSTQSDVKPQDSDDYIQDVSLDEFQSEGLRTIVLLLIMQRQPKLQWKTPTDIFSRTAIPENSRNPISQV